MIWSALLGIFFILHAFVHLLYAGQALRFFELRPGLAWPDGAWAFPRLLGDAATRNLAAVFLAATAVGFSAGGPGLLFKQEWWWLTTIGAAALSILAYLLFWDGKFHELPDKGDVLSNSRCLHKLFMQKAAREASCLRGTKPNILPEAGSAPFLF